MLKISDGHITLFPIAFIGHDNALFADVKAMYRAGVDEGAFDVLRGEPNGGESAVIARHADGSLVGFVSWWEPNPRHIWIDVVFVTPKWRRKGLATMLLASALNEQQTGRRVQFGTFPGNAAMQAIAAKAGFIEYARTFERRT